MHPALLLSAAIPLLGLAGVAASGPACPAQVVRVTTEDGRVFFGIPAAFGPLPDSGLGSPSGIALADPRLACSPVTLSRSGFQRLVVVVQRGECAATVKARMAQEAGAAAVLMFDNRTGAGPTCMIAGDEDSASGLGIPFASLGEVAGAELVREAGGGGRVRIDVLAPHRLTSAVALWAIAVASVAGGALWAGRDHRDARDGRPKPDQLNGGSPGGHYIITERAAVAFVAMASVALVVLFFAMGAVVYYILLGVFCLLAVESLCVALGAAINRAAPALRPRTAQVPCLGEVQLSQLFALPAAVCIATAWAIFRNSSWGWALQDGIGLSLMLLALRLVKIPNLKVGTILLTLFLAYDVFWVFIQPLLVPKRGSLMVDVATASGLDEYMPMVFRVPSIWDPAAGEYSILGYGDVLLPGILVAYTRRVDIDLNKAPANGYFPYTCLAYSLGLIATYGAQYLRVGGSRGQPALLYLVPFTLGTVLLLSWRRRESLMSHGRWAEEWGRGSDEDEGELTSAGSRSGSVVNGRLASGDLGERAALLERTPVQSMV